MGPRTHNTGASCVGATRGAVAVDSVPPHSEPATSCTTTRPVTHSSGARHALGYSSRNLNPSSPFSLSTCPHRFHTQMKVVDEDVILQLRIPPPPLPLAWARTVMPYIPKHLFGKSDQHVPSVRGDDPAVDDGNVVAASERHVVADIAAMQVCAQHAASFVLSTCNHLCLQPTALQREFLAVLVNPGWEALPDPDSRDSDDAHIVSKLAALQLHRACPSGFVFIWVDKQHIAPVMDLMYKWRFVYVENLNWLLLGPDNQLLGLPADYFARSHLTLFIFRKDGA